MKEGDIIWIRLNESVCCSEIKMINEDDFIFGYSENSFTRLEVVPIIGQCKIVYIPKTIDTNTLIDHSIAALGVFRSTACYVYYEAIIISLDVNALF